MTQEQTIEQLAHTFKADFRTDQQCKQMARAYIKRQLGTIEIHCCGCRKIHVVPRTWEIPSNAERLGCNWCPDCESSANAYYQEWPVMSGPRRPTQEQRSLERRFPSQAVIFKAHD